MSRDRGPLDVLYIAGWFWLERTLRLSLLGTDVGGYNRAVQALSTAQHFTTDDALRVVTLRMRTRKEPT